MNTGLKARSAARDSQIDRQIKHAKSGSVDPGIARAGRSKRAPTPNERKLRALAYEVTVAEARERTRIAAGLHDEIGQILALIRLKLGDLRESDLPGTVADRIDEVRALVLQAAQSTRSATFDLSCPLLGQLGLQAAIESQGRHMERVYGVRVDVEGDHPMLALPEAVLGVVFRVVRELLFNVHKHACARRARVVLRRIADQLIVHVSDEGIGFRHGPKQHAYGPHGGFGLYSAEVQMEAIGGRLDIDTQLGRGTCAVVTLPPSAN